MQISFLKRVVSYFYPVRIRKSSGSHNPLLELFLYRGQYQLGTADALYSDGRRYRPMLLAFDKLKDRLPHFHSVLLLGAGIGSVVQILSHLGYHPAYTLVDIDSKVLNWAVELQTVKEESITAIHADANDFIATNEQQYNLLVADIFNGRVVPGFATSRDFLEKCRRSINPGGIFVMNYMINDSAEWDNIRPVLESVFPGCQIYPLEINRVIIASV